MFYNAATAPTNMTAAAAIGPLEPLYAWAPAVDCVDPAVPVAEPDERAEVTEPVCDAREPEEVTVAV